MAPKNFNDWDNISIKIDGKKVNLEDAFEVFENVFEDVDEAFEHMEKAFKTIDTGIHDKLNKLKMKLAAKKPDKYEYIPDEDEDIDKKWEDHMEYRKTTAVRAKRNLYRFMVVCGAGMVLLMGLIVFLAIEDSKSKSDFGVPSKMDKPAITEKLEPL